VSALTAGTAVVAVVLALAVAAGVTAAASTRARAQAAADGAALAAVSAAPLVGGGGDGCPTAAAVVAAANGAALRACVEGGGAWGLRAEVEVATRLPGPWGAVVGPVRARAAAVLEPAAHPRNPGAARSLQPMPAPTRDRRPD
jgi:hypothetical protein